MALETGGRCPPPLFCQPKNKEFEITTYKSVYSNKAENRLIAKWILEITDVLLYKILKFTRNSKKI